MGRSGETGAREPAPLAESPPGPPELIPSCHLAAARAQRFPPLASRERCARRPPEPSGSPWCRGAFPIRTLAPCACSALPARPAPVSLSRVIRPSLSLSVLQGEGLSPTGQVVSRVFSPGLALCPEVQDLLEGCELADLPSSLLLPEDTALRNLPPLRAAHRRFNFDTDRPLLSALEEVSMAFLIPQALV